MEISGSLPIQTVIKAPVPARLKEYPEQRGRPRNHLLDSLSAEWTRGSEGNEAVKSH